MMRSVVNWAPGQPAQAPARWMCTSSAVDSTKYIWPPSARTKGLSISRQTFSISSFTGHSPSRLFSFLSRLSAFCGIVGVMERATRSFGEGPRPSSVARSGEEMPRAVLDGRRLVEPHPQGHPGTVRGHEPMVLEDSAGETSVVPGARGAMPCSSQSAKRGWSSTLPEGGNKRL